LHLNSSTAILFFSQKASKEALKKQLAPFQNKSLNVKLISQLNLQTKKLLECSNVPYYNSSDFEISNTLSFGKKLSLAIERVFNFGFEKVICIGNDCPALDNERLNLAIKKLQDHDFVIGPDYRGGVYLLGLTKGCYNPLAFENIAWQSKNMLSSLLFDYKDSNMLFLDKLQDIHTFKELKLYVHCRDFIQNLLKIVKDFFNTYFYDVENNYIYFLIETSFQRGPPSFRS